MLLIDKHPEYLNFCDIDNSRVATFITNFASIFSQHGLLPIKDCNDVKDLSKAILAGTQQNKNSILQTLYDSHTEVLNLLEMRYGALRLSSNLLSYTLRPHIDKTIHILSEWGKELNQQTELMFNQAFHMHEYGGKTTRVLYSQVLVNCSECNSSSNF